MKDNILKQVYEHPDREELISKLIIGISVQDVADWLKAKYGVIKDRNLILSVKSLQSFKDDHLDLYNRIREDALAIKKEEINVAAEMKQSLNNNSAYRAKLEEYLDKELDIKTMVKTMILAIESRAEDVFNRMQDSPNTKMDYVLIQWFNSLIMIIEKYNLLLNPPAETVLQQNNINIQIMDQHIGVFHKVIREVLSKLDYETSLLFIDLFNEEIKKLKNQTEEVLPVEVRLEEAKKLEANLAEKLQN